MSNLLQGVKAEEAGRQRSSPPIVNTSCNMLKFAFHTRDRLDKMTKDERLNLFRQYFATSRYNRLYIQQCLIRSAIDDSLGPKVEDLESQHNKDFAFTLDLLNRYITRTNSCLLSKKSIRRSKK